MLEEDDGCTREVLRSLAEAGDNAPTAAARESAIDRAVMEVCDHVRRAFGIIGQITREQRDDLFDITQSALRPEHVSVEEQAVHAGDFSVVYRGTFDDMPVAIKAMPTAAWRNRVGKAFGTARSLSEHLRDPSFIRLKHVVRHPEVHALVMEYVDWPVLTDVVAKYEGHRLPQPIVAKILTRIAQAQANAHEGCIQIGALSTSSIHVSEHWDVRLTPVRIEGHLARGLALSTGQLVNWDVLTMMTPEVYAGHQPVTQADLDAHEQYYLALLGVELLMGRRPIEVSCFQDLDRKVQFFDDPRSFFDPRADGTKAWTDDSPALAYLLTQMLSRDPSRRLPSGSHVIRELERIGEGKLPVVLRQSLASDLGTVISEAFASRFYERLFAARPVLAGKFRDRASQARMLADTIRDLVEFRREDGTSRFRDLVVRHRTHGIAADDVEAFRVAFVEEVVATHTQAGNRAALSRGDAWNAALRVGLSVMLEDLGGPAAARDPVAGV
jgi:hypothetical protein